MKARSAGLKPEDKVRWNTPQGETTGVVKKKITTATKVKSHKVSASKKEPEYLVQSSKSGKPAAHKERALKKVSTK